MSVVVEEDTSPETENDRETEKDRDREKENIYSSPGTVLVSVVVEEKTSTGYGVGNC